MTLERSESVDHIENESLNEKTQSEKEEGLRRWRRFARLAGLFQVGVGVFLEYIMLKALEIDTNIPALKEGVYVVGSVFPGYLVADGASDVIKGAHHYLGMTIWKTLVRNPEKKAMLQIQIDAMVGRKNSP